MSNLALAGSSPLRRWKRWAKRAVVTLIPADRQLVRTGEAFLRDGEREVHLLPRLVAPGTVAVDVGAHIGDYTYALCRQLGPGGRVIAIEPQPRLAEKLAIATRRRRMPVTIHNCALSSKEGEAELVVPMGDGQGALGLATLEARSDPAAATYRVPLRRLDDICRDVAGKISFVKIDVEGHELDVLLGATETLSRHRPNLLVEIEQRHSSRPISATFEFLAAHRYRGEYLNAAGELTPLAEFDLKRDQDIAQLGTPGYVSNFIFWPH